MLIVWVCHDHSYVDHLFSHIKVFLWWKILRDPTSYKPGWNWSWRVLSLSLSRRVSAHFNTSSAFVARRNFHRQWSRCFCHDFIPIFTNSGNVSTRHHSVRQQRRWLGGEYETRSLLHTFYIYLMLFFLSRCCFSLMNARLLLNTMKCDAFMSFLIHLSSHDRFFPCFLLLSTAY